MPTFFHPAHARLLELKARGPTLVESETQLGVYAPGVKPATRASVHDSASLAEAAVAVRTDALLAEGWVPYESDAAFDAALLAHSPFREWAEIRAEPARLRTLWPWGGAAVDRLLARIESIDAPLSLRLSGGFRLDCEPPLHASLLERVPASLRPLFATHGALALHENDDEDARVLAGFDFGPPEGDAELDGTQLEGADVTWFMSRGFSQHWCVCGERTFLFDFDGGLEEVPQAAPSLVLETIASELE